MDSSRRAVESYWRSRMIDGATSDEDKVAPVYKLEEICELLRSSHVSIGKEVSDFILKRLEHKSPVVKQKALRLIKYSVGKSGTDFRREMQRHSAVVRQLFHYKGQLDPLKGDAPNKAVRDMAHEAISAIFSEENKPAPVEDLSLNKRIQGFGNTNFEMPSEDKKSFLSEVVGLGSASIKQGLSSFAQGNSMRKNENGSYRSPNLRRSLTIENDYSDRYEPVELRNETQGGYGISKNVAGGSWNQDSRVVKEDRLNGDSSASYTGSKTREEKLLETIVTSGGVRLQPTRDAIQVLMKAICVLESILRKKDDEKFSIISSYFCENNDVVVKCSESPQSSLREKANKVLSLLGGEQAGGLVSGSERSVKAETTTVVQMPDLIDTADPEDHSETNNYATNPSDQNISNLSTSSTPLIDDLFTDSLGTGANNSEQKNADDPFADVLFHTSEGKEHVEDLFSGMTVDSKPVASGNLLAADKSGSEPFDDIFGSHTEILPKQENQKNNFNDLMAGFSINEDQLKPEGSSAGVPSESIFSDSSSNPSQQLSSDALSSLLGSQSAGMNANPFPFGTMPYNIPAGMTLNPSIASQPMNYSAMGNLFAQQQFLAAMSNLQHIGNLNVHNSGAANLVGGNGGSPLPDIFQPNFPTQASMPALNNSKKEDTRAFDFISDHLASARDSKRVA
ncbi:protein MODIFIED TRANSPORT TO THE VACUOLE 1 [Citrus sinensis]|uniref:Protein MODIFIED TRANSPORT TO THE VACUOLE 1 n=1 Tax=Citrus sinensis TaxID=2711 RepID=A0ACB8J9J5_CITSI|nr:protein MODIFIED TRANSPORT TO THE VACUOLE 1 [Citrus sinensis]